MLSQFILSYLISQKYRTRHTHRVITRAQVQLDDITFDNRAARLTYLLTDNVDLASWDGKSRD